MTQIHFISSDMLLDAPRPDPLIKGFIREQDAVCLYGDPNGGKSFLAIDWALCVATGKPWLDQYEVKQGPVIYMAGEGGASLQVRVQAWMKFHGITSLPGAYWQTRPLPLRDEETITEIQAVLETFAEAEVGADGGDLQPRLIVVDTLSQFIMGGDEVGPDMALFVSNVRRLSHDNNTAVLIVHHTNAGGERERGHTSLRGNVDTMFKCKPIYEDNLLVGLEVVNDKQRDQARAVVSSLRLKKISLGVDAQGESLDSLVIVPTVTPPNKLPVVKRTLMNVLDAMLQEEDLKTERVLNTDLVNHTGLDRSNLHRYLDQLTTLNCVKRGTGKSYLTPTGRAVLDKAGIKRVEQEEEE